MAIIGVITIGPYSTKVGMLVSGPFVVIGDSHKKATIQVRGERYTGQLLDCWHEECVIISFPVPVRQKSPHTQT